MSLPSQHHLSRQPGFTLLEILVVLILLGIIVSVAMLSIGGSRKEQLEHSMQRLQQVIRMAHEEAVLNQYELALKFKPHAYEFQTLKKNKWQTISQPPFMRRRELDDVFRIKLLQDGISVSLEKEDSGRILLFSSGEMTPFELYMSISDTDQRMRLQGDAFGKLTLEDASG